MKRITPTFWKAMLLTVVMGSGLSGTAHAWWNDDYTMRKKITIDTGATGAAVSDPIGTAPVLIRLQESDFQFASAKDDGSDIRFIAADDKTPLTFHIEKYDSLLGEAFVWVRIPDLKPGTMTSFWLYYGNNGTKVAPGAANEKGTYDPDTVLVYHFADGTQPVHDSTGNANNAQNAGLTTDGSFIGPGLRLDGKAMVTIPSSDSMAWNDGGTLTWEAWIKPTALQPNAVLFSRRDGEKDFLVGMDNGVPFVEINGTRSSAGAPVTAGTWHHLAVVADGGKITLYLNGAAYATLAASLPALTTAATIVGDTAPTPTTIAFVGEMDELEISKTARPAGFIKLASGEEGADSAIKWMAMTQDEQPPAGWLSGSFGLFGVILKSVTVDGWVVIGILGIMGVISWCVMINKFIYLIVIEKGNGLFLKQWQQIALDLTVLDHTDANKVKSMGEQASPKVQRLMRESPLYHIYHIGSAEIGKRMTGGKILSSRSIQAIRASLDSGFVRENHALTDGLVFLTISIAGGPFMGLLGTVIGVMITFAEIAATGEVNVASIAPGLSAALVATVAGLLVAIPALLGYNYLVSRMKTVTSDLQIFIDEFVTKMAEFYSNVGE